MAKTSDVGIKQLDNGNWAYRLVINRKDLKHDSTCRQDDRGNPFKTKKAAKEARELKLVELKTKPKETKIKDVKLVDVYNKYITSGITGKASSTITKQKSMWKNHINKNFGNKYLSEITLEDLTNYLKKLYAYGDGIEDYKGGYSYAYTEGFLKFFYLLFGSAYRDDLIDHVRYSKMFIDKGRLKMPKKTQEDELDEANVKAYKDCEIAKMDEVFKGSNLYTAFLMGIYLGVRISECFALRYSDIDWINGTITVHCQMVYEEKAFCLVPTKTVTSVRTIDIPDILYDHLYAREQQHKEIYEANPSAYRNTELILDKTIENKVERIVGGDFINRKENGELLTNNSFKYWSNEIKEKTGIDFLYHSLRKTHATMLARMNTPIIELMSRMGHKKFETTKSYYLDENKLEREQIKQDINSIAGKLDKGRQLLKAEIGTPEDNAKLQKFRETVLYTLTEFDGETE